MALTVPAGSSSSTSALKTSMRLFGMPYQFTDHVDPRWANISKTVGKKFSENISMEAPILTIIPGKPRYLPGVNKNDRYMISQGIIEAASENNFDYLKSQYETLKNTDLRLYDFERAYTEYMDYVNALCRAGAAFLGLTDTVTIGGTTTTFQKFDWRNYKWNDSKSGSVVHKLLNELNKNSTNLTFNDSTKNQKDVSISKGEEIVKDIEHLISTNMYVQFYVETEGLNAVDTFDNQTTTSMLSSLFSQISSTAKDYKFVANSFGAEGLINTLDDAGTQLNGYLGSFIEGNLEGGVGDTAMGAMKRILNLGGNTLRGDNIIIPNIYAGSGRDGGWSGTIKLRTPYCTRLGYYLDIFVPTMHLLALVAPKQSSANSYESPFLVKAYINGTYTCNLGLVTSLSITKSGDSRSLDGLPAEVDITMQITDLYSNIKINSQNQATEFLKNASLIEYLSTTCGLSLIEPNLEKKVTNITNNIINKITDIGTDVKSTISEWVYNSAAWMNLVR